MSSRTRSEGAATARSETGTAASGQQRATAFLAQNADSLLGAQVQVRREAGRVSVTVTGRSVSLLPGVAGPAIEQTATGPVERFTSPETP